MEYKLNTASTWTAISGSSVTGLAAGTYNVRIRSTSTAFASASVDVTVTAQDIKKESKPAVEINFSDEVLTKLVAGAAYTVNSDVKTPESNGSIAIEPSWFGQSISIIKKGIAADDTIDSEQQELKIPSRPAAPTPGKTDTTGGNNNGSITDINNTMEYRITTGIWTDISGNSVTGLAAGTYNVRIRATSTSFASATVDVIIAPSNASTGGSDRGNASIGGGRPITTTPTPPRNIEVEGQRFIDIEVDTLFGRVFADVNDSDWFFKSVQYAIENNLMVGTSATEFSPNSQLTRGMVVTVLYRYAGEPYVSGFDNPFNDVGDSWYTNAVLWAAENDIVTGYGDGRFGPEINITRQDLAVILNNYAKFAEMDLPTAREYAGFADDMDIRNYAKEAIERFFRAGIINGKPGNLYDPQGNATRAEFATMLMNFLEASIQTG